MCPRVVYFERRMTWWDRMLHREVTPGLLQAVIEIAAGRYVEPFRLQEWTPGKRWVRRFPMIPLHEVYLLPGTAEALRKALQFFERRPS